MCNWGRYMKEREGVMFLFLLLCLPCAVESSDRRGCVSLLLDRERRSQTNGTLVTLHLG